MPDDGYVTAFYEIAEMLGIPAQVCSPKEVWEAQMRPALQARLAAQPDALAGSAVEPCSNCAELEGRLSRAYAAKCRCENDANFERKRANDAEAALAGSAVGDEALRKALTRAVRAAWTSPEPDVEGWFWVYQRGDRVRCFADRDDAQEFEAMLCVRAVEAALAAHPPATGATSDEPKGGAE